MVPRVPVLVALVLMLIQIPQRRRTFYCETCGRYIRPQELLAKCNSCNGKRRPRFLTPLGTLACKCPSHTCLERKTISYGGNARTRFSRLFPYGAGNRSRQSFLCGVCGNEINMGNIINLSWYSGTEQLAMNYCRNFLAQGFGSVNLTGSGVNFAASTSLPSELIFGFRTKNRDVRRAEFRLHFAVKGTERKLWSSEETMLLLDGAAGAGERDAVIDAFLLDLQELNVAHASGKIRCWWVFAPTVWRRRRRGSHRWEIIRRRWKRNAVCFDGFRQRGRRAAVRNENRTPALFSLPNRND